MAHEAGFAPTARQGGYQSLSEYPDSWPDRLLSAVCGAGRGYMGDDSEREELPEKPRRLSSGNGKRMDGKARRAALTDTAYRELICRCPTKWKNGAARGLRHVPNTV